MRTALVLAAFAGIAVRCPAAEAAPPQGVVALSASATVEVVRDWMNLALATSREGADPAVVQAQLKQALDAALVEARKAASPGRLELRTGSFNVFPRYNKNGAISGWQGSTELLVEGRDLQAIGQLAGRISTLTIGRVGYDISRELRQATEAQVAAEAITRYRARAADYAARFGYASYALREVEVTTSDAVGGRPRPMMAMKSLAAPADETPLATEPGTAGVTVTVTGSVQLTR